MDNSVCTVHHDLEETDPWLNYKERFHDVYLQAKKIICLNSNQENFLKKLQLNNTKLIPHGYNEEVFLSNNNAKKRLPGEKVTLGLISKRYGRKVKGEEYLYELVKQLDNKKFKFLLVGSGRTQDAIVIRSMGFEVKVYEYVPYNIFSSLYDNIDILLMLSLYEGGPANIPEAVITGTPIIGNNIGMVSDYVKPSMNGYFLSGSVQRDLEVFNNAYHSIDNLINSAYLVRNTVICWKDNIDMHFDLYNEMASNTRGDS
nr:glycosyltransferase [Halomonas sp. Ps84H-12]